MVDGRDVSGIWYLVPAKNIRGQLVARDREFIEDLGFAIRIFVHEDCSDDKGLISVSNGDQIITGSVMMQLMVMEG